MGPGGVTVTGGTGYLGRALIEELVRRKLRVHALVRNGSKSMLPRRAEGVRVLEVPEMRRMAGSTKARPDAG